MAAVARARRWLVYSDHVARDVTAAEAGGRGFEMESLWGRRFAIKYVFHTFPASKHSKSNCGDFIQGQTQTKRRLLWKLLCLLPQLSTSRAMLMHVNGTPMCFNRRTGIPQDGKYWILLAFIYWCFRCYIYTHSCFCMSFCMSIVIMLVYVVICTCICRVIQLNN